MQYSDAAAAVAVPRGPRALSHPCQQGPSSGSCGGRSALLLQRPPQRDCQLRRPPRCRSAARGSHSQVNTGLAVSRAPSRYPAQSLLANSWQHTWPVLTNNRDPSWRGPRVRSTVPRSCRTPWLFFIQNRIALTRLRLLTRPSGAISDRQRYRSCGSCGQSGGFRPTLP